jgi:hypothetical protein
VAGLQLNLNQLVQSPRFFGLARDPIAINRQLTPAYNDSFGDFEIFFNLAWEGFGIVLQFCIPPNSIAFSFQSGRYRRYAIALLGFITKENVSHASLRIDCIEIITLRWQIGNGNRDAASSAVQPSRRRHAEAAARGIQHPSTWQEMATSFAPNHQGLRMLKNACGVFSMTAGVW